ncbi:MAG TPA: hypothetical protein DDY25_01030 [Peptococcaceae bacterium]|nr:hypothetical protein [Peptococcaceae bacterium]
MIAADGIPSQIPTTRQVPPSETQRGFRYMSAIQVKLVVVHLLNFPAAPMFRKEDVIRILPSQAKGI